MASIPGSPIGCGGTNDHACTATSGANRRRASSAPQRSASREASDPSTPTTIAPLTPSGYNDSPAKRRSVTWISWPRMAASRVTVYDVGPRDGLQNEPEILDVDVRAELVRRLADAGVPGIEVASFVDPRRVPQMAGAEEVVAAVGPCPGPVRAGLALNERGYERLVATGLDEVRFAFGVTESFNQRNQGAAVEDSIVDGAAHRCAGAWRRHALRGDAQRRVRVPVRG